MFAFTCLAIVWAALFVSWAMRKRSESRPASSVVLFRRQLSTLERATPGTSLRPVAYRTTPIPGSSYNAPSAALQMNRSQQMQRRQNVLVGLGGSTFFTMLLLLVSPGAFTFLLFVSAGGALGAYCYALVQLRRRADEAAAKVRILRPQPAPRAVRATPALAVRRTASS